MRIGELCAGYTGLGMGVQAVFGGDIAWVADSDPGCSAVLAHRYPHVDNLGDITQIAWGWEEPVDVLTAGFPCQDVSAAGQQQGMRAGTRTGVWSHVARAIKETRPPLVALENVRGLLWNDADSDMEPCTWCVGETGHEHSLRAAGAVCGDLASLGYDAVWRTVSADRAGACHERERVFFLAADTHQARLEIGPVDGHLAGGPAPDGWGRGAAERGPVDPAAGDPELPRLERPPWEGLTGAWRPPGEPASGHSGTAQWGKYGPAVRRWESVLGRPAPPPNEPGRNGPRLSALFVEWMMGLPQGWVTAAPGLTRNQQLQILGNGVVPQQGALAYSILLRDLALIS